MTQQQQPTPIKVLSKKEIPKAGTKLLVLYIGGKTKWVWAKKEHAPLLSAWEQHLAR